jgi:hypothetical protein
VLVGICGEDRLDRRSIAQLARVDVLADDRSDGAFVRGMGRG